MSCVSKTDDGSTTKDIPIIVTMDTMRKAIFGWLGNGRTEQSLQRTAKLCGALFGLHITASPSLGRNTFLVAIRDPEESVNETTSYISVDHIYGSLFDVVADHSSDDVPVNDDATAVEEDNTEYMSVVDRNLHSALNNNAKQMTREESDKWDSKVRERNTRIDLFNRMCGAIDLISPKIKHRRLSLKADNDPIIMRHEDIVILASRLTPDDKDALYAVELHDRGARVDENASNDRDVSVLSVLCVYGKTYKELYEKLQRAKESLWNTIGGTTVELGQ